ncbi:MAG TPA: hypothetical protein VHM30_05555 [Gemmatimonadaceae bacterium]|nr:hypothetical protein [Gemmatimonadaceae bacterium]
MSPRVRNIVSRWAIASRAAAESAKGASSPPNGAQVAESVAASRPMSASDLRIAAMRSRDAGR